MKKNKKYIIISYIIIIVVFINMPLSLAFLPDVPRTTTQIVSRGVAMLLCCMQVLQYSVPMLFFIVKLIVNKKKTNNKNTFKNICLYLFIAIVIFLLFMGIGNWILNNTSTYGYSSKTIDYIRYNGKIVYFHR